MNAWGLHHDANQYEDPGNFNPVRFMQNKYGLKDGHTPFDENRKQTYVFGAGRRVCPDQKMHIGKTFTLISCGLPTLNLLFRRMDARSILRSIRSLVSLNWNRTDHRGAESYASGVRVLDKNISTSPQLKIMHSNIVEERDKSKEYKYKSY